MEDVLWYVLASTRGGPTRACILTALDDQPRNANQLAETLEYDYTTIRHHLDVLVDNGVIRTIGEGYGVVYAPTDRCRQHWDVVEEITDDLD